jgi:hypothetical protein
MRGMTCDMMALTRLRRLALCGLAVALAVVALPVRAAAQETPQQPEEPPASPTRPFRGLFNSRPQEPGHEQSLTMTLNAYGGYDDNVVADQPGAGSALDPGTQAGGGLAGGDVGLAYTKAGHRVMFNANADSSVRYVPNQSALGGASYGGGAGINYQLARRTQFSLTGSVGYQPFYQLGLFPGFTGDLLGAELPSNLDFTVLKRASVLGSGHASLEHQLSRRSSLTLGYDFFGQTFTQNADDTGTVGRQLGDVQMQGGLIRFRRQVSRYLTVKLGYQYQHATYKTPANQVVDSHNIDAGVDYARSLAFSRHTTLAFSTGSSIVTYNNNRFYDVIGNARLTHLFTKYWRGSLAYNRNVNFVASFLQPFFTDGATAEISGQMLGRAVFTLGGGYVTGKVGLTQDAQRVHTGTASAAFLYTFTTMVGAQVSYSYYNYDFSTQAGLPLGLKSRFDRNSVRAGLTVSLPLVR